MPTRTDRFTINTKQIEFYSDFRDDFALNPITGYLFKVSNEDSIKQAIKNLVLTKRTERFYNPFIGTRLESMLFDPMDTVTQAGIEAEITETINNNEPRVTLQNVSAVPNPELNQYDVTITFIIKNFVTQPVDLTLVLQRVR